MKQLFSITVFLMLCPAMFPLTASSDNGSSMNEAASLINLLGAYFSSAFYHRYPEATLSYRRRTKSLDGSLWVDRLIVENGQDIDRVFGSMNLLFSEVKSLHSGQKSKVLKDIKPSPDQSEGVYTFTLLEGFYLRETENEELIPVITGKCQILTDGRPLRCILEVTQPPKGYDTQQIQLVWTWGLVPIQPRPGEPILPCWLPTEVLMRGVVRVGKTMVQVWSHLELEGVISLNRGIFYINPVTE